MSGSEARILEDPAAAPNVQTARHLIAEIERAHRERQSSDVRIGKYGDALELMFPDLPAAEREQIRERLDNVRGTMPPATSRGGEFFDNVVSLFKNSNKREWTITEAQNELSKKTEFESKTLHNTINYLAKTGFLRRVGRGQYLVVGSVALDLHGAGFDGTTRATEHEF
jgi:hypothetical protein